MKEKDGDYYYYVDYLGEVTTVKLTKELKDMMGLADENS